jgi:hypothetical protein
MVVGDAALCAGCPAGCDGAGWAAAICGCVVAAAAGASAAATVCAGWSGVLWDDDCPAVCCAIALSVISRKAVTIHFEVRITLFLSSSLQQVQ